MIASVLHLGRLFQEVGGRDSKMPFHITVALTIKHNGEFRNLSIYILWSMSSILTF